MAGRIYMSIRAILKKNKGLVFLVKKKRLIVKNIKQFFLAQKIKYRIKSDTIVHLMFNDKFNKPYVDFLNEYFDSKQHIVLCKRWFTHPFPTGKNVFEIETLKNINLKNVKKIICHSLFDDEVIDLLYSNKELLKKSSWIVWGGDLYDSIRDEKNDYVRSNFSKYLTGVDQQVIKNKYNKNAECIDVGGYLFPITKKMLDEAGKKSDKRNYTVVQINNSSDKSTIEVFHWLEKFKNENIMIRTIVSYGDCKDEVIKEGVRIFGEKFEYLENYLNPQDYAFYISNSDILILNQNRQQGVGNTKAFLYLKKKVFIRSDVSTYNYLYSNNIHIDDTLEIKNMSFDDFIKNDYADVNKACVDKYFDLKLLSETWAKAFV